MLKEAVQVVPHIEIPHTEIACIKAYPTLDDTARVASEHIIRCILSVKRLIVTFATGDTMVPVYAHLGNAVRDGRVSLVSIEARELDEYFPCAPSEVHSFVGYHRRYVWNLGVPPDHIYELNGETLDPEEEVLRYGGIVHAQPSDLMILGIGPWDKESQTGGHIGFNEPGTPFTFSTHVAQLYPLTINRDRIQRQQRTPDRALTQGIADILAARDIMVVAYGKNKGLALAHALYDPISVNVPASALRLVGERVRMYIDQAAASVLEEYTKLSEPDASIT